MPDLIQTADIAVAAPIDKSLTYAIPGEFSTIAQVGVRVRVPLGRRTATGYILSRGTGSPKGLKPIQDVLDSAPLFSEAWGNDLRRAAAYYRFPIGDVLRTALPAGLSGAGHDISPLRERLYQTTDQSGSVRGKKQQEILAYIRKNGPVAMTELRDHFTAPHSVLNRLVETGFLTATVQERIRDPFRDSLPPADKIVIPGEEQAVAINRLLQEFDKNSFSCALLHGVTGSGKTEIYLRLIEAVLANNKQALVLVPEIALTPQLVGRFRARFSDRGVSIAVLHSGLSDGERYDAWRSIMRNEIQIVIGARSAVFAPLPNLGVIVVDEEHETSYKQAEGFRYNARDFALLRGQSTSALVVLGSATPSPAVYKRAQDGDYLYLRLSGRVAKRPLPPVSLIDLREAEVDGHFSSELLLALGETLQAGDQSLLLLNRRGFSPYLICAGCGTSPRCPNCAITLTYYQGQRQLRCNYCDYSERPSVLCPKCNGPDLLPEGVGTEQLESELATRFPAARIARMDRDTTGRKGSHQRLVQQVLDKEIDILVGTQMVAKGHDFPGVTLVGVLDADNSLNFPDFRSAERTFSLLSQVAGRAGRGEKPGRVLVQTYSPDHYALQSAATHDYAGFYAEEIPFRESLGYPPFGYLINLVFSGNDADKVAHTATNVASILNRVAQDAEVLGPAPCPLARLRGKTRFQILLKGEKRLPLHRMLQHITGKASPIPAGVRMIVDIDPIDML
ncbi:MAG: primosomal protein N' [Desulfuromonadales bacterium]|nr:primosomal protein N' [Desulfuromonadales bacterium]